MRRAALALPILFLLTLSGVAAARADCASEVQKTRERAAALADPDERREVTLLLDKAATDAAAGRERLCYDALDRAEAMLH
jgi:hypothetical protein